MGTLFEGPLSMAATAAALAGIAAAALGLLAVGVLRRALRRMAVQLREIRRHPAIGDLPPESEPSLRPLALELNGLLSDLRKRLREGEKTPSVPSVLAGGPTDLALVGLDGEWTVISFSRGAVRLTGWEPVEILDRHVEALFAAGDWERILPKLARRSLMEEGISETVRLQRRDGTAFPARISLAGDPGEAGAAGPMLLAARDLSAERDLEQRLRDSEERYRRLVEEISDGIFIVQDERLAFANRALARLLGLDRDRLGDRPVRDIVDARDLLRVLEVMRRAERGEEPEGEITCLLAARGGPPVEARVSWSGIEFQGRRAVIGTVVDISERARFDRALLKSESRLQATLQSTGDGILVLEPSTTGELRVTLANRAFLDLFGLSGESLLRAPLADLRRLAGERCSRPERFEVLLEGARAGREERLEELEIVAPRRALVDLCAGTVRSPGGDPLGLIVTARDVTARVESAAGLRRSLDDLTRTKADLEGACTDLADAQKALAERNAQLETLNAELRSLDEMKSNLLANVSHELHTPLVSIKGYTEMILKRKLGPLTPEQERGLGVALKNVDRLIEMIDNLLSFSRMEKGETQLSLEDVPFWQLVDEAMEMVGERIRKKNITMTTQYETDGLVVRCDRVKIGQVLTNLLTNAVKFNREGGRITLAARRGPKGFIEVDVADTGVGIPPEALDKIFERFYQVDATARRRYEGTGIGLSIVRDILRLHGCSIRVASEVGKGSVFTITLPLARDQEVPTARPPAAERGRARD